MVKKGTKLVGNLNINTEKDFQKEVIKALIGINNNIENLNNTIGELNASVEQLKNATAAIAKKQ